MQMGREDRIRHIYEDIVKYGRDYQRVNGKAVPFRLISARFARAFMRVGLNLREAIEADPRLILRFMPSGSYTVEVLGTNPFQAAIFDALREGGGVAPYTAIKDKLKGSGLRERDLIIEAAGLVDAGRIKVEGEIYTLLK